MFMQRAHDDDIDDGGGSGGDGRSDNDDTLTRKGILHKQKQNINIDRRIAS